MFQFRAKHLKKWSAPTIVFSFIFLCMLVILSLETVGLIKQEETITIEYQRRDLESQKTYSVIVPAHSLKFKVKSLKPPKIEESTEKKKEPDKKPMFNELIRKINTEEREEKMEKIKKILLSGAVSQEEIDIKKLLWSILEEDKNITGRPDEYIIHPEEYEEADDVSMDIEGIFTLTLEYNNPLLLFDV